MSAATAVSPRSGDEAKRPQVIDCDVHHMLKSPDVLLDYLPASCRRLYTDFGLRSAPGANFATLPRPFAARADAWPPAGGPPGSDLGFLQQQLLDAWNITHAILTPHSVFALAREQGEYGLALHAALNDWTRDRWLDQDDRLYASISVPSEQARLSLREIERLAPDRRFVQVGLVSGTREPLGAERYWPIYEIAEDLGLPVAVHVGGAVGNPPTGAGWPSYYVELHTGYAQVYEAHFISLLAQGVFERFPKLRIVFQEGGLAWVPALSWRLDAAWERLGYEIPHVRRPPSSYLAGHLWFTTQPIEEPARARHLAQLFEQLDALGLSAQLLFATDYPHWDFDAPDRTLPPVLGEEHIRRIVRGNAAALYGWDGER